MQNVDVSSPYDQMTRASEGLSTTDGEYEFSEQQNTTFRQLSSAMKFVGVASIVLGFIVFLGALKGDAMSIFSCIVQGSLSIIVGFWLRGAAESIARIATTEGNDVSNLMNAMGDLRKVYSLQRALLVIVMALLAVAFVVGVVIGMK